MPDAIFADPRLAAIYDALEAERNDLETYVRIAEELGARRVLDIGCGTGTFALLLAERGLEVTGVDPAEASLNIARAKADAERVRWIRGDATTLPALDLATMTGNVAQAILPPSDWGGNPERRLQGPATRRTFHLRDTYPRLQGMAGVEPRGIV
jgi:SAM-dependent methyltransferase